MELQAELICQSIFNINYHGPPFSKEVSTVSIKSVLIFTLIV